MSAANVGGPVEPVRVNHTKRNIILSVIVVLAVIIAGFFTVRTATASKTAEKGSAQNPVTIGVVGATNKQWKPFLDEALKQGIHVKLVDFQDYTSENPAVDSGQLDMNAFQHLLYLANYNVKNGKDLQPIGPTGVWPLGLYSKKVKSVDDIKQGDTVLIPNDETNQARAIGVLKDAGLVKLKGKWTAFVTPADIDESASKVKVLPVNPEKSANALSDPQVVAGVVTGDYITDAGLAVNDTLAHDDVTGETGRPYINAFVTRKADAKNPVYLKLANIFANTQAVKDGLQEQYGGTTTFVNDSAEQLQQYLAQIEADEKASEK
ncbi:MetQ/NlpA family ABC transporter substrate-binding protein [Bifidobacterium sp. SO4]|uniref:MetQ/NlpA family ABC transporter substrate-binding protein n=1 Tax=Bifidobacterium sp. SO4 TaxID=2809030 RepID=UPI001BDC0AC0|nr:MetQ/NlpA family ABC transporter substrate-binding protein [Bifidobacterium sp. SO4]MBT1170647.1 ABC transporter substrate-binding protein [Bifidobacterium sp. SO4]